MVIELLQLVPGGGLGEDVGPPPPVGRALGRQVARAERVDVSPGPAHHHQALHVVPAVQLGADAARDWPVGLPARQVLLVADVLGWGLEKIHSKLTKIQDIERIENIKKENKVCEKCVKVWGKRCIVKFG